MRTHDSEAGGSHPNASSTLPTAYSEVPLVLDDGSVVIYDAEATDAWLQSTHAVALDELADRENPAILPERAKRKRGGRDE